MRPERLGKCWLGFLSEGEAKLSEEYKRWEARYSAPDYIFGKAPNYFLAKCKPPINVDSHRNRTDSLADAIAKRWIRPSSRRDRTLFSSLRT